uniref:Edg1 TPR repeats region domain-containing protein n=1 Tax=Caenorhabditis japonica TaxID=281687 RepID=A0A8R1HW97_CAEJA
MNSPEESAVRDLNQFTSTVLGGMLDMHGSAAALIRYSFQVRTIRDVVRRGSENPELINQIFDSLNHLVIYLNEEIVNYATKVTQAGMENRHFNELIKRMQLLYEIWLAMTLRAEYQDVELTKHVDASREAIKFIYDTCRGSPRWNDLPDEQKEFFLDIKPEKVVVNLVVEPTLFARDDGVVSSVSHEQAQSDEEGKKKQFVTKTEKVETPPKKKKKRSNTKKNKAHSQQQIIADKIRIEWKTVDGLSESRLEILHKILKTRKNIIGVNLVLVEQLCSEIVSTFVDHQKEDFLEKSREKLMWHLLVSPAFTLQQLLNMCIDNKGYVPLIIRIFRSLPTLFDRQVHVTPLAFEDVKKEKLLITMLHRVFMIGRTTWTSAMQWENAGFMTLSLAKNRKKKEGQNEVEEKAILDSYSLIQFALSELMIDQRKPQKAVETFVRILQRVLANNNNARMLSNYAFENSYRSSGDNKLCTPIILNLMYELLVEYDSVSADISDGAREILKSIGGRLETEAVVFDDDTILYLTEHSFNSAPWWIKYCIYSWFSAALRNPKRQVPSGIYQALPELAKDDFEQIMAEESSTLSQCFLRSLFELGLFDVQLAIDLLHVRSELKIGGTDVVEKIALALVDSYGKKFSRRNGGMNIGNLIKEMLITLDPIRDLVPLKSYSTSYFHSISKIEHILVLFMAARIAKEKQLSAASVGNDEQKNVSYDEVLSLLDVSDHLMDIFCEVTKAHVEKEAAEVAQLKQDAKKLMFSAGVNEEKWKIMLEVDEREQSLILQLTMLYLKCSHFTRLYQKVPIKLQQLMNVTLDKQFDSQKSAAKRVMDDILTEQRKTEVVYAFAERPAEPKESEQEAVQPVKPSEILKPQQQHHRGLESTSAENVMFQMNGGELADFRQGQTNRNYRGNGRRNYSESDRSKAPRPYRGNRWNPVNDTHAFAPREREIVYHKSRYPPNEQYDYQTRNDRRGYDHDKLYFDDRGSSYAADDVRRSQDVRNHSESRESLYDPSSDYPLSRRVPSDSDFSLDDSENRHIDKTLRSLRQFQHRESFSSHPGSSCSPPPQLEAKQPKKGFGAFQHGQHNTSRKQNSHDRKPRYTPISDFEQEEEGKNRLRAGQPEREEIVQAMGSSERSAPPNRGHRQRGGGGLHYFN